ncbi:hypothetical protein ATANTOWER_015384 [Ataeniobius toweri]|uniref:Uncharacterized protein n=1 Tax=Ataeniobius toweri TaxID=208326 RepID=A0ABU7BYR4_9TELE|nr:hypothetical protein [Ataeniobius toweri]
MVTLEELQKSTAQRVEAGGAGRMKAAAAGGSTQCQESSGRHTQREREREKEDNRGCLLGRLRGRGTVEHNKQDPPFCLANFPH